MNENLTDNLSANLTASIIWNLASNDTGNLTGNLIGSLNGNLIGNLIRSLPSNEIFNFIEKVYYKKFASKKSLEKLAKYHQKKTDNFLDYQPLLFLGKTSLHTNHPVLDVCSSYRLTLLAHFFDDTSAYSIGSLLRLARNR